MAYRKKKLRMPGPSAKTVTKANEPMNSQSLHFLRVWLGNDFPSLRGALAKT